MNIRILLTGFFITLLAGPFQWVNADSRGKELIELLNEEYKELRRLSGRAGNRNPQYLVRMSEVLFEKARIIKEMENARFLKLSAAQRRSVNKTRFFKQSNSLLKSALNSYKNVLKRFKTFKNRSEALYAVAAISSELRKTGEARKYYNQALKTSPKTSRTNIRATRALAVEYYNSGGYRQAIPLYERIVDSGLRDKWLTQDMYNLGWCYYRTRQFQKAISVMEKAFHLKDDSRYINMTNVVIRDLGYFYVEAGNAGRAISFYRSLGGDSSKNLLRLAKYIEQRGNYTSAKSILEAIGETEKDVKVRAESLVMLLGLYDRFGKTQRHFQTCQKLKVFYDREQLSDEQLDKYKFQVQKMAAILQKQVLSKTYATASMAKARKQKAFLAKKYFDLLREMKVKNPAEIDFFIAETFYSAGEYDQAIDYYYKSYNQTRPNSKINKRALTGLLAVLGRPNISKRTRDKYLIFGYHKQLQKRPRGPKSIKVYQRLFTAYYNKRDIPKAENVLLAFKKNHPRQLRTQEAMLAKIMDYHKNRNDKDAVRQWISRIRKGEFKVSKKYGQSLRKLLLSMQFENIEEANKRGDKKTALLGYMSIYNSKKTSHEARRNAAYNLALLFYQLRDLGRSYDWAQRALSVMTNLEVSRFQKSFMEIARQLFHRRMFSRAAITYRDVFRKLCNVKSKNKDFLFKNASLLYFADGKIREGVETIKLGEKCGVGFKYIKEAKLELLELLGDMGEWRQHLSMLTRLESDDRFAPFLIHPYARQRDMYIKYEDLKKAKLSQSKIMELYRIAVGKRMKVPLMALDEVAKIKMSELNAEVEKLDKIPLKFPENAFNKNLQAKFLQLDRIGNVANKIFGIGSGEGMTQAYKYMIESYLKLVDQIANFSPPKKSASYIKSFKKSMNNLVRPLRSKAMELMTSARKQIVKDKIVSVHNSWFLSDKKFPITLDYRYLPGGVIMDRGGRQ